jgi:hypothetical protein
MPPLRRRAAGSLYLCTAGLSKIYYWRRNRARFESEKKKHVQRHGVPGGTWHLVACPLHEVPSLGGTWHLVACPLTGGVISWLRLATARRPRGHRQDRVRSFRRSRWLCACVCRGGLKVGVGEKEKKARVRATARRTGGAETKMSDPIELGHRNKRHGAPGGTGHLVACPPTLPLAGGASSWLGWVTASLTREEGDEAGRLHGIGRTERAPSAAFLFVRVRVCLQESDTQAQV